ncbi:hypothetical protein MY4038_007734 [Beauveria bassiana]
MSLLQDEIPWNRIANVLNVAYSPLYSEPRMTAEDFPRPPGKEPLRPLPDDYAMRGLGMSKTYFPADWFSSTKIDDEEKMLEQASLVDERNQHSTGSASRNSQDDDICPDNNESILFEITRRVDLRTWKKLRSQNIFNSVEKDIFAEGLRSSVTY